MTDEWICPKCHKPAAVGVSRSSCPSWRVCPDCFEWHTTEAPALLARADEEAKG